MTPQQFRFFRGRHHAGYSEGDMHFHLAPKEVYKVLGDRKFLTFRPLVKYYKHHLLAQGTGAESKYDKAKYENLYFDFMVICERNKSDDYDLVRTDHLIEIDINFDLDGIEYIKESFEEKKRLIKIQAEYGDGLAHWIYNKPDGFSESYQMHSDTERLVYFNEIVPFVDSLINPIKVAKDCIDKIQTLAVSFNMYHSSQLKDLTLATHINIPGISDELKIKLKKVLSKTLELKNMTESQYYDYAVSKWMNNTAENAAMLQKADESARKIKDVLDNVPVKPKYDKDFNEQQTKDYLLKSHYILKTLTDKMEVECLKFREEFAKHKDKTLKTESFTLFTEQEEKAIEKKYLDQVDLPAPVDKDIDYYERLYENTKNSPHIGGSDTFKVSNKAREDRLKQIRAIIENIKNTQYGPEGLKFLAEINKIKLEIAKIKEEIVKDEQLIIQFNNDHLTTVLRARIKNLEAEIKEKEDKINQLKIKIKQLQIKRFEEKNKSDG